MTIAWLRQKGSGVHAARVDVLGKWQGSPRRVHRRRPAAAAGGRRDAREAYEDEGFGGKDPRRFNFRRAWPSGDDDVVAGTDADNWNTAKFRAFVWGDADGRANDILRLTGTRDLVNEFDLDVGPHP